MLEKMGKRAIIAPIGAVILVACILSLLFYPIANMQVKDLPFAIVNLDEGVTLPTGDSTVMGDAVAENIESMMASNDDDADQMIVFTQLSSQEELDDALQNNEYYGYFVIPADFSETMAATQAAQTSQESSQSAEAADASAANIDPAALMAAAQARGIDLTTASDEQIEALAAQAGIDPAIVKAAIAQANNPQEDDAAAADEAAANASSEANSDAASADDAETAGITVILDNAKSPLIVQQLKTNMTTMLSSASDAGMSIDIEVAHEGDTSDDGSAASANPMTGMMSQMITIMPLVMMSMISGLLIAFALRKKSGSTFQKAKAYGIQVGYSLIVSLCISAIVYWMATGLTGIQLPAFEGIMFLWITSFCLALLVNGLANIHTVLAVLAILVVFALGMTSGYLPSEGLPTFWRDFIYPWVAERFVGEGIRSIAYMGAGFWNSASLPLLAYALCGLVAGIISLFIGKADATDEEPSTI